MKAKDQNSKKDEKKFYYTAAGKRDPEHRYRLVPTSKKCIRQVCEIQSARIALDHESRARYADQAGYTPTGYHDYTNKEDNKSYTIPEFEVEDIYSEYYIHAALAQVLFDGFPDIIQVVEDNKIEIVDEELFDELDAAEVSQAFLDFQNRQNPILQQLLESFVE